MRKVNVPFQDGLLLLGPVYLEGRVNPVWLNGSAVDVDTHLVAGLEYALHLGHAWLIIDFLEANEGPVRKVQRLLGPLRDLLGGESHWRSRLRRRRLRVLLHLQAELGEEHVSDG